MPPSRDGLGPFYQGVIAVNPLEPWDAASAAYRLEKLARTLPLAGQLPFVDHGVLDAAAQRLAELGDLADAGEVLLHGDFYLGNVLVHGDHVSALIDFEYSRMGPRDLELISVVRALDAETRLGLQRPPLFAWLAEDYPELFGSADLHKRLWLYALAYAIRQIIFWPPDRAEADDLEVTHPLHTLRRLIDAPLPLPAADLPYFTVAMTGPVAVSGVRGALTSADTAVICRAKKSGTVAVGISASGSSLIGALDGVTLSSWNPVRAPRVRATTRSVMPNALNHKAARRPVPCVSLRATSGAARPAAMSPRPAGRANSAGRWPRAM